VDDWKLQPASDTGMPQSERLRSLKRESGIVGIMTRHTWWFGVRAYLRVGQRLEIEGRENIPIAPPFVLAANHASHLDALILAAALPMKLRTHIFPIAAGDTFFETPSMAAFAAGMMNALPMWRKNCGAHAMLQLRERLTGEPCSYILFPEGTRSRTGKMAPFKPGLGMIVAGTPVPVVPCHLMGTFDAMPPDRKFPRRARIRLRIGRPMEFSTLENKREGWTELATRLQKAIEELGSAN